MKIPRWALAPILPLLAVLAFAACPSAPPERVGSPSRVGDLNIAGQTTGDTLVFDGTIWNRLAKGTTGQTLVMGASLPAWGSGFSTGVGTRLTALDAHHIHAWEAADASGSLADSGSSATPVALTAGGSAVLYQTTGLLGACVQFTSATSYFSASTSSFVDLPSGAWTLEAWFRQQSIDAATTMTGIAWSQSGANNVTIGFAATGTSWTLTARTSNFVNVNTGLGVTQHVGEWRYIMVTYDGATTTTFYVDGEAVLTNSGGSGATLWSNGTTPKIYLGYDNNNAPHQYFGQVSRVRLSDLARAQSYGRAVYAKAMYY